MFFFIAVSLLLALATEAKAQVSTCKVSESLIQLNFDDLLLVNEDFIQLVVPYKEFTLLAARSTPYMLLLNTSYAGIPYFSNSATTGSNIIFTDGEPLTMYYSDQTQNAKAFTLLNFSLTSIFLDNMSILVDVSRNNKLVKSLPYLLRRGVPTLINVGEANIDRLFVHCLDEALPLCAHMAFDSFRLCH